AAWAAVLRPDAVAAEPVASPQRPRLAVEALAVAAAQPLAVSDARPREAAGVADGSLAAAEAAAGSPAAPVPVAALAAQPTAVALPMATCGWRRWRARRSRRRSRIRRGGGRCCRWPCRRRAVGEAGRRSTTRWTAG